MGGGGGSKKGGTYGFHVGSLESLALYIGIYMKPYRALGIYGEYEEIVGIPPNELNRGNSDRLS